MLSVFKKYTLIALFSLLFIHSNAQDYIANVKTFGIEDGLIHSDIEALYQDSQGWLWIATRHGVNYYDSDEFRRLKKGKDGLTHEKILDIAEDEEGFLWLLVTDTWSNSPMNINFLNVKTHEILSFQERFGDKIDLPFATITDIETNELQKIFIRTNDKKIYQYASNNGFQTIELTENISLDFILKNDIIGRTIKKPHLARINGNGQIRKTRLPSKNLMFLTINNQGIPIYHSPTLGFFKYQNEKLQPFSFKDSDLLNDFFYYGHLNSFAYRKSDDTYWFSLGNRGVMVFHSQKGLLYDFHRNIQAEQIYIDHNDLVWLVNKGLTRVNLEKNKFQRLFYKNAPILENNSFRQILKSNATLHVISGNGVYQIDALGKTSHNASSASGTSILEISPNQFLYDQSFFLHLYKGQQLQKTYPIHPFGAIWSMYQDKFGKIWLGGNNKFGYLPDLETTTPIIFDRHKQFPDFKNAIVYQFFEKSETEVWLISTKGIFVLNTEKNAITRRYWNGGTGSDFLPKNNLHHIQQDKKDKAVFWLATTEGLVKWNTETSSFEVFDAQKNGLPNEVIYAIYSDASGDYLWMSSNMGIIQMNVATHQFEHYLEEEGITHFEFNRISHFQDETGKIYFGSLNGITAFHPQDFNVKREKLDVPMRIIRFQQFNGRDETLEDKTSEIRQYQSITIQPNDRFIILDFVLLDFKRQNDGLYAYKIEGLDENWNFQEEKSIRLSHLPYGKYTLKIKGQTHRGTFSTEELTISIHVLRPFYKSWWFILLCVLIACCIIFGVYQWRVFHLRKRNQQLQILVNQRTAQLQADKLIIEQQAEELKKLDELKSSFFVNVSHELRTPLTLILSPVQILLKNAIAFSKEHHHLHITIQQNARKLLRLTEDVLQLSKLEANKLELNEDAVLFYPYFMHFFQSFQPLAKAKNIDYTIDYRLDEAFAIYLDKQKFEHIIGNLISNALKYTLSNGEVSLIIEEKDQQLNITVQDSGIGIHQDDLPYIFDRFYQTSRPKKWTRGTGIGLALAKELTVLFNGSLSVESNSNHHQDSRGSIFIFKMPYKKAILQNQNMLQNTTLPISDVYSFTENTNTNSNRPTILLVEDNIEMNQFLVSILSKKYNVLTAQNGLEAIEWLDKSPKNAKNHLPSLIISDIMMPQMNGFELLERLKKHPQWIKIPVILLSAKSELQDKLKALTVGIDDYVTKPFVVEELLARIQNSLNNARNRQVITTDERPTNEPKNSPNVLPKDLLWLETVNEILHRELQNSQYLLTDLAQEIALSDRQLHRRIKSITGLTPNKYIREFKLNQARNLLETGKVSTVAEVTYAIGFDTPYYFSTIYQKRFGKKPQAYFERV